MEDALCLEPGFQGFLSQALSQEGVGGNGDGEAAAALAEREEEGCKLRSKAAFVLKVSGVLVFVLMAGRGGGNDTGGGRGC